MKLLATFLSLGFAATLTLTACEDRDPPRMEPEEHETVAPPEREPAPTGDPQTPMQQERRQERQQPDDEGLLE
jgi:hypothetical protein